MKQRRPLAEMQAAAAELVAELAPYCERIEIAGSIRRRCAEVADVEIVAVPRLEPDPGALFGDRDALDAYTRAQVAGGRWRGRPNINGVLALGERHKRLDAGGVALDLFIVLPPASWGAQLLIRTGPAEYSKAMMVAAQRCGLRFDRGALWCGVARLDAETEADVLAAIGERYIEPEARGA